MGVWTPALKNQIIYEDGSVQKIKEIPDDLKAIYKYVIQYSISLYPTRCN
jgi:ribonucleoside-diphosphate reductase subunit M1